MEEQKNEHAKNKFMCCPKFQHKSFFLSVAAKEIVQSNDDFT